MFGFCQWNCTSSFHGDCFPNSKNTVRGFISSMGDGTFTILYGSQTGQAKAIAEEICEQSESYDLKTKLFCLSTTDKKFSLERESLVVFVVSTTGDGEPPDTVSKFWRRLRKKTLGPTHLKGLRYALLGLGDTNYTNFCNCSKMLNSRLLELGATHFYPPGFADDAVGLEIVVEPWIEGLWPALKKALGSNDKTDGEETPEQNCKLTNGKLDEKPMTVVCNENASSDPVNASPGLSNEKTVHNISPDTNSSPGNAKMTEGVVSDPSLERKTSSLRTSVAPLSDCDLSIPVLPAHYLIIEFNDGIRVDISSIPWQGGADFPGSSSPITPTKIVSATRMTRGDAVKTALSVTFDTGGTIVDYKPGDSFGILCSNDEKEVDDLIVRLGYKGQENTAFTLKAVESSSAKKRGKGRPEHIPELCTIKHALLTCLEIRSVPRKAFLRVLCEYTTNPTEKRRLQELCSKQGAGDYSAFIREPNVSFIDILNAFPSCKPPFERLLEHLPRLLPRPYSASCSPLENPTRISIVFNIVKFSSIKNVRDERRGVCTGWLEKLTRYLTQERDSNEDTLDSSIQHLSLESSLEVHLFRRKSTGFHLPEDPRCPIIMIGPGTGVAPFVGFLQHRQYLRKQASEDSKFGAMWLFYGCRHRDRDFLFKEELTAFEKNGVLTKLLVSFSRDISDQSPGNSETPKYVQDNIRMWGECLCDLIYDFGAYIFVCGDARNMAKNVLETFINVFQNVKGLQHEEAQKEIWRLRQEQRYVEDVWT